MKRVFGMVEAIFNIVYLMSATIIAVVLFVSANDGLIKILAAVMASVLVIGDAFHLVPRILVVITKKEDRLRKALGIGKQITSITMTIFYLILFQVGVLVFKTEDIFWWMIIIYALAIIRIVLCLLPQNKWIERYPPLKWSVWRNIPFFMLGIVVAWFYFINRSNIKELQAVWLAIILSFAFYLPVVLWSNKNPKIGMLMLPKTCVYVWILVMFLAI